MPTKQSISDEALVIETRARNKERYAVLVKRYEEKLMRYATYIVRDPQNARDVVQESFIKAYINLNAFDATKQFSSWLYRIVHNEALNSVKKHHKEIHAAWDKDWESEENIEHEFTKKELIARIHTCLYAMPVLYREPLSLYYLEDKSYEDISDILRLPMGTVATRINRAKARMKIICQNNP